MLNSMLRSTLLCTELVHTLDCVFRLDPQTGMEWMGLWVADMVCSQTSTAHETKSLAFLSALEIIIKVMTYEGLHLCYLNIE